MALKAFTPGDWLTPESVEEDQQFWREWLRQAAEVLGTSCAMIVHPPEEARSALLSLFDDPGPPREEVRHPARDPPPFAATDLSTLERAKLHQPSAHRNVRRSDFQHSVARGRAGISGLRRCRSRRRLDK